MGNYTIEIAVHSVIMPVFNIPNLDVIETTVLQYLKEGFTQSYISETLGFNSAYVIRELKNKKLLNNDSTLKYKNKREMLVYGDKEYKKAYLFYSSKKDAFFDFFFYPNEISIIDGILINNLGDDYVSKDILSKVHTLNTFTVRYDDAKSEDLTSLNHCISKTIPITACFKTS